MISAFLRDELSVQDNLIVQNYLTEHMDDSEIQLLLKDWFNNCRVVSDKTTNEALNTVNSRLGNKVFQLKSVMMPLLFTAALFLAVIVSFKAGYAFHKDPVPVVWNEINVPTSETRELDLPDGTHLTLSAESRITWPSEFRGSERSIFFEGEVNAVVAKNPEIPFIIHTGGVDVCVHGTTFSFKSYRNDTMVKMMLLEGSVSLNVPSEDGIRAIQMAPGDIVQYNRKEGDVLLEKMSVNDMEVFSSTHALSFLNEPLGDIVSHLERSFGAKIIIADSGLASSRYLAVFKNHETLDQILDLLSVSGGLRIVHRDGCVYLYKKK